MILLVSLTATLVDPPAVLGGGVDHLGVAMIIAVEGYLKQRLDTEGLDLGLDPFAPEGAVT